MGKFNKVICVQFLFNVLAAIVLVLGFFSPKYGELFSPQTTVTVLLGASIVISISIGILWFTIIKRAMSNSAITDIHKTIDALLKNQNCWLQGVRPIASASHIVIGNDFKLGMTAIRHRFMSTFLMAIWALGIGTVAMLILQDVSSSRGLSGVLLESPEGKGLAIAFGLYISISSLAFSTVGFLAFINKESSK